MERDQQLYQRIRKGDQLALQQLHARYYSRLSRFVGQFIKDIDLAQEVINDVFLAVWQSQQPFEQRSQFSTWIMGVAYRQALSALRKTTKYQLEDDIELHPMLSQETSEPLSVDIKRITEQLSPRQKAIVELTYYFGYTYKEVGDIIGCPENTVKTTMLQTRKALAPFKDLYKTRG